jgi:GDP-mannose 6-dehydrogenase
LKVSIFGLGYVGCVSLGCLAKDGHNIVGVDLNKTKVDFINRGEATIVENGIAEIISEQHKLGRISATSNAIEAVQKSEISIICVGTPSTTNGHLNLKAIFKVAEEIGKAMTEKEDFHIIVIRSTVLPGTNAEVCKIVKNHSGKKEDEDFAIVSNPEFLREGSAVEDFYNPPFTLVGSKNEYAINRMRQLYKNINASFYITEIKAAELMKYVNNAFHALKIIFANEIGNICNKIDVDSHQVMKIFCKDSKLNLSPYYLKPGFAYGGSCLPKDLKALKTIAHDHYLECPVLENIERSNDAQKKIVLDRIVEFNKKNIGFLGLSFKAGTDDLRNSPIIDTMEQLLGKGYNIKIYDKDVHFSKLIGANREYILRKIPFIAKFLTNDLDEVVETSDVIIIVNREDELLNLHEKISEDKIIYDLVNINLKNRSKYKNYTGIAW